MLYEKLLCRTPISANRETLCMFSDAKIILAVPEASADSYEDLGVPMFVYKSGIKLEPVFGGP